MVADENGMVLAMEESGMGKETVPGRHAPGKTT
jgi:hypothetical protein